MEKNEMMGILIQEMDEATHESLRKIIHEQENLQSVKLKFK